MPSTLRPLLLSTALSLTFGCNYFGLDQSELDKPVPPPAKATGKGGAPGAAGKAATAASGGMTGTGTGGGAEAAGTGGTDMSGAGTGGSATAGGGGTGGDTAPGAGGSNGGMPSLGGMGGDVTTPAGGGGMESSMAGMGGAPMGSGGAGSGCTALNPGAQPFGGHCYLLVTTAVNWDTAKNGCTAMNAHLVTISLGDPPSTDAFNAEDMFVYTFSAMQDTWLGLTDGKMPTDPGDGTPYSWITGEAPPPAGAWQSGEPNNYNKPCMNGDSCYEHCGFMVAGAGDLWNDDLCEAMKQYVCEWDMGG